jgi:hypothetical protein
VGEPILSPDAGWDDVQQLFSGWLLKRYTDSPGVSSVLEYKYKRRCVAPSLFSPREDLHSFPSTVRSPVLWFALDLGRLNGGCAKPHLRKTSSCGARYFYLLSDMLCYSSKVGASEGVVKYFPLDRIPVRAYPRGYRPALAVTVLERHATSAERRYVGRTISLQCGDSEHFLVADTAELAAKWVEWLNHAWLQCYDKAQRKLAVSAQFDSEQTSQKAATLESHVARLRKEVASKDAQLQAKDTLHRVTLAKAQEKIESLEKQVRAQLGFYARLGDALELAV